MPWPLVVKKGRKMLAKFSGEIPLPSSATVMSALIVVAPQRNMDRARFLHCLNRIEQQIQEHLVDLIGIVIDRRNLSRHGSSSIMMRLVIACWRANITACSAVPAISLIEIVAALDGQSPAVQSEYD